MKRIPIAAAREIAKKYGYDQVVIVARKVGEASEAHGEHVTTYGVNRAHCASAAAQGRALQRFMGWPNVPPEPAIPIPRGATCTCGHSGSYHNDLGCGVKVGSASCDDAYCSCGKFEVSA